MIGKRLIILVLMLFISQTALGAKTAGTTLLPDGFTLNGIDGKLARVDSNESPNGPDISRIERWFFKFDSDLSTDRGQISAGTSIELLPSAALEKMTTDVNESSQPGYRLWGRVTKYQGQNFIFAIYFLSISEIKQQPAPQKSQQQSSSPTINEPDDQLAIPEELIAKLATRRIVRPEQFRKGLELKQDAILVDRTGFIRESGHEVSLDLDALGRNVQSTSLRLLPCEVLQRAMSIQSDEPDPMRFKIAGIITQYKGNYYLLLQRATQVYSHGNFAR